MTPYSESICCLTLLFHTLRKINNNVVDFMLGILLFIQAAYVRECETGIETMYHFLKCLRYYLLQGICLPCNNQEKCL